MSKEHDRERNTTLLPAASEDEAAPTGSVSESTAMASRLIGRIVVAIILVSVVAMLVPWILSSRAAARRTACLYNLKAIGAAFQDHVYAQGRFPPSCYVKKDAQDQVVAMDGFSWIVDLLPYMGQKALYDTLDVPDGLPLGHLDAPPHPHTVALGTLIPELHCPSFDGLPYANGGKERQAITNYKAIGATHIESLSVATPRPMVPKYGDYSKRSVHLDHPDGAIYPGSTHGFKGFENDGTTRTAIVVESIEPNVARWTVGAETCVVTLPPTVTFAQEYLYYHPTGFTPNAYFDESTIPPEINKTYLDWDYDSHPYRDALEHRAGIANSSRIKYGPSSPHPGVTHHVFADGNVHALSNKIDAAMYMYFTTRNNGDPNACISWPLFDALGEPIDR